MAGLKTSSIPQEKSEGELVAKAPDGERSSELNRRSKSSWFARLAQRTSQAAGRPLTFASALGIVLVWGISGPAFGFSDTWQLVINTGTTIVTFLMVFLIQNSQNRDTTALHLKLDELLRAVKSARNEIIDLEECDDAELERIRTEYRQLAEEAHAISEKAHAIKEDSDEANTPH